MRPLVVNIIQVRVQIIQGVHEPRVIGCVARRGCAVVHVVAGTLEWFVVPLGYKSEVMVCVDESRQLGDDLIVRTGHVEAKNLDNGSTEVQ